MTASAPSGTVPPVAIPIASPGSSGLPAGFPAGIRSRTGSRPGVSPDRRANPSIAELSNGGRSTRDVAGSTRTRPAAESSATGSASNGRTRSRIRRWASSMDKSAPTSRISYCRDLGRRPRPRRGSKRRAALRRARQRPRPPRQAVGSRLRGRRLYRRLLRCHDPSPRPRAEHQGRPPSPQLRQVRRTGGGLSPRGGIRGGDDRCRPRARPRLSRRGAARESPAQGTRAIPIRRRALHARVPRFPDRVLHGPLPTPAAASLRRARARVRLDRQRSARLPDDPQADRSGDRPPAAVDARRAPRRRGLPVLLARPPLRIDHEPPRGADRRAGRVARRRDPRARATRARRAVAPRACPLLRHLRAPLSPQRSGDLGAARRAPVVFNPLVSLADTLVEDRGRFRPGSLAERALRTIDRRALRSAEIVVADTSAHAEFLARLAGLPRDRLEVCFVGAEERLFQPDWRPQ